MGSLKNCRKMKKTKRIPRHVKITKAQERAIQRKANLYAEGNFSKWMRYAAMHFVPHEKEIIKG